MSLRSLLVASGLGAMLLMPASALACGGFFCNNQTMDQSGEEILFAVDPDASTVKAVIRIFYQGDAEDFAWVLPVPSVPKLGVSTDEIFLQLRQRTQPSWQVQWAETTGQCWWEFQAEEDFDGAGGGGQPGGVPSGGVEVLDSGQVGDFDFEVVKSDDGQALFDWLNDNGYVQPPASRPLIEHYVAKGMVFVALKLQQNAGAGDITPIVLEMEEDAPCVPLVLTQIAAQPDMPVRLYVASTARAVPNNWFGVEVNQKKIDWINYGSNYDDLVSTAVDEAAGHGFVTEYAGSSDLFQGAFYSEGMYDLASLQAITNPAQWVMALQDQFSGTPTLLGILRKYVPMPAAAVAAGVDEQSFYNWPEEYDQYYDLIEFDPAAATEALDARIVQPRKEAQEITDRFPYFTRMYTKVSPDEMNRDPLFGFNSGLPDVAKDHVALGVVTCDEGEIVDVQLTLPDTDTTWKPEIPAWRGTPAGYEADDLSGEPDAAAISLYPTSGDAFVVEDRELIAYLDSQFAFKSANQLIGELTGEDPAEGGESGGETGGEPEGGSNEGGSNEGGSNEGGSNEGGAGGTTSGGDTSGSDGCNASDRSGAPFAWLVGFLALGLGAARRRSS